MIKNKNFTKAEPGKQEMTLVREFNAPPELIFQVMTDPKQIPHWWGPRRLTTKVDKMEAKDGGSWRFIQHDIEGNEYAFHGVFHEVSFPVRTIQTFEWEGYPEKGHVILETAHYEELPNSRTKVTIQSIFQSVEDRDGMIAAGAEEGLESYDRIEEILIEMKKSGLF